MAPFSPPFFALFLIALLSPSPTQAVSSFSNSVSCVNKADCTSAACSDREAAYRAGHLCHGFPWFNGGYPMKSLQWDYRTDEYSCNSMSPSFCGAWNISAGPGGEPGNCTCLRPAPTGQYCREWTCEQLEANTCKHGETRHGLDCCGVDDDGFSYCYEYYQGVEITNCTCSQASSNSNYCASWHCVATGGIDLTETEISACAEASNNGQFCQKWESSTDSVERFAFGTCECSSQHQSGLYCSQWSCAEKLLSYHNPDLAVIAMPVLVGLLGLLLIWSKAYSTSRLASVSKWVVFTASGLWMSGFLILGVYLGGFVVLFFTVGIWAFCVLAAESIAFFIFKSGVLVPFVLDKCGSSANQHSTKPGSPYRPLPRGTQHAELVDMDQDRPDIVVTRIENANNKNQQRS